MKLPNKDLFKTVVGGQFALSAADSDFAHPAASRKPACSSENDALPVLTLDSVEEHLNLDANGRVNFSLHFSSPLENPISQGTYSMDHEKLGSIHLFLVPYDKRKDRHEYLAVICSQEDAMPATD